MPENEEGLQVAIYATEDGVNEVVVHVQGDKMWATQTEIAEIFSVGQSNVSQHITKIFQDGEVSEEGNFRKIKNGFDKPTNSYSLDVIISVGYRVNAKKATHFRQWATNHLKQILTKGYSVDESALLGDPKKLEELYTQIRSLRTSEISMYQKVRDVFKASSSDYDETSQLAHHFFATAQDKFLYAVTNETAAEVVLERADGEKENVGMVAFRGDKPKTKDVTVAKNYLNAEELRLLENISEQFLLFAESKAFRGQKMTMEQISHKLNTLLEANDYPVLWEYSSYKRGQADEHAKAELRKYQNRLGSGDVTKALDKPDSTPIDATEEALKRAVRVPKPKEDSKEGDEEQPES